MEMGSNTTTWVGKTPFRRLGGISDALSIAAHLGFPIHPPSQDDLQNTYSTGEECDDFVRILRELTAVQRNVANLQVELQGRKDDKNVAHLTHVGEMEKKCATLARITSILKAVIQNKDRIIARLQQPFALDCIPVEAEYQKDFSELLINAASDFDALTSSVSDFQWSQNFNEPPSVWGEMLRPIPVALASCIQLFEATSAMRESFATLQDLRVCHSSSILPTTPANNDLLQRLSVDPGYTTPWKIDHSLENLPLRRSMRQEIEQQHEDDGYSEVGDARQVDDVMSHRMSSWPPV